MPYASKLSIINTTIRMLGLDHVRDQIVGSIEKKSISGGERKRASIGLEIVSWPTIIFMDEPTSGNSSFYIYFYTFTIHLISSIFLCAIHICIYMYI